MSLLPVPVEYGPRGPRGGRPGWLFDEVQEGQADIRKILAQESAGKGYPDSWVSKAQGSILDMFLTAYEAARQAQRIQPWDGYVFELVFPSGTRVLLGTQTSLRMVKL